MAMKKISDLKERHHIFVKSFLSGKTASQAVIDAGFKTKYPAKSAYAILKMAPIRQLIDEYMDQVKRTQHCQIVQAFDVGFVALQQVARSKKAGMAKVEAAKELIHLAGHVPEQSVRSNITSNIKTDSDVNINDARDSLAKKLASAIEQDKTAIGDSRA